MRRWIAVVGVVAAFALQTTAAAEHEHARHDCFGSQVAGVAGPELGQFVSFLACEFAPLGEITSFEARTCEEVFD